MTLQWRSRAPGRVALHITLPNPSASEATLPAQIAAEAETQYTLWRETFETVDLDVVELLQEETLT